MDDGAGDGVCAELQRGRVGGRSRASTAGAQTARRQHHHPHGARGLCQYNNEIPSPLSLLKVHGQENFVKRHVHNKYTCKKVNYP